MLRKKTKYIVKALNIFTIFEVSEYYGIRYWATVHIISLEGIREVMEPLERIL